MNILETFKNLRAQMVREPLPTNKIAAGWALGMFVGCSVPFGLQLIVSVPLAIAMKVSKIGATVATFITNPATIVFIYPAQIWVGSRILGAPLDWAYLTSVSRRIADVSLMSSDGWRALGEIGERILGGFFIGGLLVALVMTPLTYFLVTRIVTTYRKRKHG